MNEHEVLKFWEAQLLQVKKEWLDVPANMKKLAYLRDVFPYVVIFRNVREKAGIDVCSGSLECLNLPSARCEAGQHPTCATHKSTCYLCGSEQRTTGG